MTALLCKSKLKHLLSFGLITLLLLTFQFKASATLSGTYTIDSTTKASSTNYTSFRDAISDLLNGTRASGTANGPGVSSSVTFEVADGLYEQQLDITAISGASGTNRITFRSKSGNRNKVILIDTSNSSSANYLIHFDGASFITFRDMTLSKLSHSGTTSSTVLFLENNSDSNSFINNVILGDKITSSYGSTVQSVVVAGYNSSSYTYSQINNLLLDSNLIKYGSFSVFLYGNYSSGYDSGNIVRNNVIDSSYNYGLYAYYQSYLKIQSNTITNGLTNYYYGIYAYNNTEKNWIEKNKIILNNGGYGIYAYYSLSTSKSNVFLIDNNFISLPIASSTNIGIYHSYCQYINIFANNIYINGGNTYSYGLYSYYYSGSPAQSNIYNNNVFNSGTGYSFYLYHPGSTKDENNNNFYSTSVLKHINYNGTDYTLSGYKTASGKGAKSLSINPKYYSNTDLHVSNIKLNNVGRNLISYGITTDIDGDTRSTTPDIGADEFTPRNNDLAAIAIDSPAIGFCAGTKDIYVRINNAGINTVFSGTVSWSINGVAQSDVSFTSALGSGVDSLIKLGITSFTSTPKTIKAIIKTVNSSTPDSNQTNDTTQLIISSGLSGSFTVGGSTADFNTLSDAVTALLRGGVCGPVVFNILDGTYSDQVSIPNIKGASSTNTITFQSKSLDPTKVTIDVPGGSSKNYIFELNGAKWITIKYLTLTRSAGTTSFSTGNAIDIHGQSKAITVSSNVFNIIPTGYPSSAIYSGGDVDSGISVLDNFIKGGYYTIFLSGNYGTDEKNNIISNNTIDTFGYYGIYTSNQNNLIIDKNRIINPSYSYSYGLMTYNVSGKSIISNNYINMYQGYIGLYMYYFGGNSVSTNIKYSDTGLVYNNQVYMGPDSTGKGVSKQPVYVYYPQKCKFYYNTFISENSSTSSNTTFSTYTSSTTDYYEVVNNVICNYGLGAILQYNSGTTGLLKSDYNDYYQSSGFNAYIGGTTITSLTGLKTSTGKDKNSLSVDPIIKGRPIILKNRNTRLYQSGIPIFNIKSDYYGIKRDSLKTTIGANEIVPAKYDAGVFTVDSPSTNFCPGTKNVYARLFNYGLTPLTSTTIHWVVNGVKQTDVSVSSGIGIKTNKDTLVSLGSYSFVKGSTNVIAYTDSFVNGSNVDLDRSNDSATRRVVPALGGTYTIGSATGRDYKTVKQAMEDLNTGGICSSVIFNIDNGTYSGYHYLGRIKGTSSINTITFQGTTTNPLNVVLDTTTTSTYSTIPPATLTMAGTRFVKFKNMAITATGGGFYGNGVYMYLNSYRNIFKNVYIKTDATSGYGLSSNTDVDSSNIWDSCAFVGGYSNIYLSNGGLTVQETNNKITNSTFDSAQYSGISMQYNQNFVIFNNKIKNIIYTYGGQGISLNQINGYFNVSKNYIHLSNGGYGIYSYYASGTSSKTALISNNMIIIDNLGGASIYSAYGIYNYQGAYINTGFNSIRVDAGTSNDAGIYYYYTGSKMALKNNNVETTDGMPIYLYYPSSLAGMDNNNYFDSTNGNVGNYSGTTYSTMTDWRTATGVDKKSVSVDPNFKATTDLHSAASGIADKGVPFAGVTIDFDNQTRSTTKPDIGCDEFTPVQTDASAIGIVSPTSQFCGDSNTKLIGQITNLGTKAISSCPVKYIITDNNTGTVVDSATILYSRSLATSTVDTITLNASKRWNNFKGGEFTVTLFTILPSDSDRTNDTSKTSIVIYPHFGDPSISSTSTCSTTGTINLIPKKANPSDSLYWYDSKNNLVFKGDTFPAKVTGSKTYYVQAHADTFNAGADPSSLSGSSSFSNVGSYLTFDTKKTIFIDSVDVIANTSGTVTVEIYNSAGTKIGSKTSSVSGSGSTERIPVKIKVPYGTDFSMRRSGSAVLQFSYDYSSGGFAYPFSSKYIDVTGATLSGKAYNYYYPFFYNWVCNDTDACASKKVAVSVTVGSGGKPVAQMTVANTCSKDSAMFTDKSSISSGSISGATISFGDGTSSSIKVGGVVYHKYSTSGTYKATITAVGTGGCSDDSSITVVIARSPIAGFTYSKVCEGDSSTFNDTTTITSSSTRTWYFDGVKSSNISKTLKYLFTNPKSAHSTSLVIKTTASGCSDSINKSIILNTKPDPSFKVTLKSGYEVDFKANDTTQANYSWTYGDGSTGNGYSVVHYYSPSKRYTATLNLLGNNGCKSMDTQSFYVTSIEVTPNLAINDLKIAPNPFKENTVITYNIADRQRIAIQLLDLNGRIISNILPSVVQNSGSYKIELNANQLNLPSGMYLIKFIGQSEVKTKSIQVLR